MEKLEYRKYCLTIVSLVLVFTLPCIGQTYITGGNVSGIWALAGSPYYIQGEITVPNGETLIIEPGIDIIFSGHFKFNIQGQIIAIGTNKDSISFTAGNQQTGWHGIRFNYTPNTNDTSKLIYCSFSYGKANTGGSSSWDRCGGAILIGAFDKVFVSDCLFKHNMSNGDISTTVGGAVIFIKSASPSITNSTFRNNSGTTDCAILCSYSSIYNANSNPCIIGNNFLDNSGPHAPITCCYNKAIISNNFIAGNITMRAGGGIFTLNTEAIITNNIIINNQCFGGEGEGGGIKCWINDKSVIINNTIAFNSATHGGGICCNQNSDPILINNIIWGNTANYGNQINLLESTSDPYFFYCDIQGGKEGFGGTGAGTNYTGIYENNIDTDPLFVSVLSNDFHLTNYSPCMEKGIDSLETGGIWYYAPPFCFSRNPRPSPVNTKPDIGACENENLVDVKQDIIYLTEFVLYQNYPNPFNPNTKISWQLPEESNVTLKIFNTIGEEIVTVVNNEYQNAGEHSSLFIVNSTLPSGVYFYQLRAGDYVSTKKMLLLK
jgi:hypothetical protein